MRRLPARLADSALTLALAACAPQPSSNPPSIVLIVADSLAAAHTEPYGSARRTTPCLTALADSGTVFEGARSQTAWTLPAVASLFSGLPQELHGLRHRENRLPLEIRTLAQHLSTQGYRTHAVVQNRIVDSATGLARGFDEFTVLDWDNAAARRAVDRARAILRASAERPLFLYVHLVPPHMPYTPPDDFRDVFASEGLPAVSGTVEECRYVHRQGFSPADPHVRALARRYDEHVRFADALLGELLDADQLDGALVSVVSDHGEAFMQHGSQGHNATVYEEMVRVPWILRGPGVPVGRRVARPVVLQDVGPTLLELAGLPPWTATDRARASLESLDDHGRSQADALGLNATDRASNRADRRLLLSSRYTARAPIQLALLVGSEKLIANADGSAAMLFDLELDPGETFDLGLERPARKAELLDAARARFAARCATVERAAEAPALDPLAELGYTPSERARPQQD